MVKLARARRVAMRPLDLDYPFHTALVDGVRAPLALDLARLIPRDGNIRFVSTVSGDELSGSELGGLYWWRNVRQRVRFADAVATAIRGGARLFVEIGPRPVLQTYLNDGLSTAEVGGGVLSCDDQAEGQDAIRRTLADDLDRIFADPLLARALMGVRVESLRTGQILYQRDSGKLVVPASNMKIVTMAVAAERLGSGLRHGIGGLHQLGGAGVSLTFTSPSEGWMASTSKGVPQRYFAGEIQIEMSAQQDRYRQGTRGPIVTVEEHMVNGGLGEACAATLLQNGVAVPFRIVGIPDEYTVTGAQADIFRHYGLTMEGLCETALSLLQLSARQS
jgi:hypothetical protein